MNIKRRLSLFLCLVLAFTTICFTGPQETKAASTVTFYGIGANSSLKEIQVYKDSKNLYAGDFIYAFDSSGKYYGYLSMNSGVTYKSSKTSVATVNSTGKLTLKGTGTTTITVKFKGQSVKYKLKVVSKKSSITKNIIYYSSSYIDKVESEAKSYLSATGTVTKITTSNRYKILNAYKNYDYSYNTGYSSDYNTNGTYTYYVYSPSAVHANAVCNALSMYASDRNPFSTHSSKCFKIKSISGKNKKVTVTLKDKVSEDQIFGSNYDFSWDSYVKKSNTHTFPIYIQDTTTKYKYYAVATINKGSKTMSIEIKNMKLKKGRKYKLVDYTYNSWLDGTVNKTVTFKAK